jgi:vacuolar-type H+-ATPase subunit I/STV1
MINFFYIMLMEVSILKNKFCLAAVCMMTAAVLTACGGKDNDEISQFKEQIDSFCLNISDLGTQIDSVDAESENAVDEVLGYIDEMDAEFKGLAEIDFPEQFDYLESIADEASEYMSVAAESFRDAYTNESYDEEMFKAEYEYARENEARAYKRVQIIITLLHGESPESVGLVTTDEAASDGQTESYNE